MNLPNHTTVWDCIVFMYDIFSHYESLLFYNYFIIFTYIYDTGNGLCVSSSFNVCLLEIRLCNPIINYQSSIIILWNIVNKDSQFNERETFNLSFIEFEDMCRGNMVRIRYSYRTMYTNKTPLSVNSMTDREFKENVSAGWQQNSSMIFHN